MQLRGDKLSRLEYRASEALLERVTKISSVRIKFHAGERSIFERASLAEGLQCGGNASLVVSRELFGTGPSCLAALPAIV